MTFRVHNHKTFYNNNSSPDPTLGFTVSNTDDENLIADVVNVENPNPDGLRIYNTDTQYATVV